MIWAPALVLVTALSAAAPLAAGPNASTYDEAACASSRLEEGASAELADLLGGAAAEPSSGRACAEPLPPAPPVIIDCNDPGVSVWVGEMIGSCDMPRPVPPTQAAPTAVRSAGRSSHSRVSDGWHASHDSSTPVRSASRVDDDAAFAAVSWLSVGFWPAFTNVTFDSALAPDQAERPRLERPPRGV
jgi:hypothetical protein